jgi:DegV family protein with EDD domain
MAKIAFVTDSTSYIPKDLMKGHEIHIVPSLVIWGGEELRDGVDVQPEEFYKRLGSAKELPTTSQPTPASFKDKYEELVAKGFKDIVSIHVSSKFSGTIASAEQAKTLVPDANVEIVDGLSASMGTGWPMLKAAEAAKAGKSFKEVTEVAKEATKHTGVLLMVDTLEFLHRGGRIGGGARFLGTALNLKPILEVVDGKLESVERVRTKSKAMERLLELVVERVGSRTPVKLAAIHANAPDDGNWLLEEAKKRMKLETAILTAVSPAVGTHTGPGTLGFAFMAG